MNQRKSENSIEIQSIKRKMKMKFYKSLTRYSTKSKDIPFLNKPGPIPLGNQQQQIEFQELLKKTSVKESLEAAQGKPHPDALKSPSQQNQEFQGNVNPNTGERNGPKGKEPTRYGDWERNGRVYDF